MSAPPLLAWGDGPAGSLTLLRACYWQADSDADRGVDTKASRSGRLPPILCVGVMKSTKSKILRALPPRNWQGLSMVKEFRLFRGSDGAGGEFPLLRSLGSRPRSDSHSLPARKRANPADNFAIFACRKPKLVT